MNLAHSAPTNGSGSRTRDRLSAATFRKAGFAVAIVVAPLVLIPGTIFNPAIGGIGAGAANIAANAAANPLTNEIHVYAYVVLSFLLPISVIGIAGLAMRRSPWLGTIGGALGIVGWLPFGALAAQDDLTFRMAEMGGSSQFVSLWDRFTTDPTMLGFLLVYIVCHLVAYVVLPVALRRARYIPAWAAWALALTSPLTIVGFATRQIALVGVVICALLLIGSVPTAWAVWRSAD
ncbi:MAG: hypothetical protein J2P43_00250 [Candidatus Dormibacteraeota bacterium]|nr:hypothetical protein [Candidatus Dormibacteraeota bacterium]